MCYFEEVSALDDLVIDGRLGVELLALAVVGVGGLVWEAVVIGRAVKPEQRPVLDISSSQSLTTSLSSP